jgi:hypothetical protein
MGTVIQFPGTWYPNALLELMKRKGIPLTRENYIAAATISG